MRARVKINKHAVGKTQTQQVVILKGENGLEKGCLVAGVAANWESWLQIGLPFFPAPVVANFPTSVAAPDQQAKTKMKPKKNSRSKKPRRFQLPKSNKLELNAEPGVTDIGVYHQVLDGFLLH